MDKKRRKVREWLSDEDYFMGLAHLVAAGSKNPHQQVGAVVADANGRRFAVGTDIVPAPLADSAQPWDADVIIHAEIQALRGFIPSHGGVLFVTARPCLPCVCEALNAGIRRVIFCGHAEAGADWNRVQEVARQGFIQIEEFKGDLNWIRDHIKWLEARGLFG